MVEGAREKGVGADVEGPKIRLMTGGPETTA